MKTDEIRLKTPTPIFRIFDEEKAKEFYLTFLEFKVDWEFRLENDFPIYMQVSFDQCIIQLTEHYGDCCPGASIRIEVKNLDALHTKLSSKQYKYARPGIEKTPWSTREIRVGDPFGNRIVFFEYIK
ncbi:glyoxalase superfamily protein [Halobacillus mangrovi]|uniref:glyoxalase superfamily protein n=1 Tax=Halobacillus mangrovi TaxID=402384 RepID=UPI003D989260